MEEVELKYFLFIDDERDPVGEHDVWVTAKNSRDAMACVRSLGMPKHISFDHDLGGDDTAMRFLKEFAEHVLDLKINLSTLTYYIHSQNPVGRDNIDSFMKSLITASQNQ